MHAVYTRASGDLDLDPLAELDRCRAFGGCGEPAEGVIHRLVDAGYVVAAVVDRDQSVGLQQLGGEAGLLGPGQAR
jgi:hypothetical protein